MDSELDKGENSVPPRFPVFVLDVKHHLGGAMIADSSPPIRAIKPRPPSLPIIEPTAPFSVTLIVPSRRSPFLPEKMKLYEPRGPHE